MNIVESMKGVLKKILKKEEKEDFYLWFQYLQEEAEKEKIILKHDLIGNILTVDGNISEYNKFGELGKVLAKITRTKAFKNGFKIKNCEWCGFGDVVDVLNSEVSKSVYETGEPRIVFHGTDMDTSTGLDPRFANGFVFFDKNPESSFEFGIRRQAVNEFEKLGGETYANILTPEEIKEIKSRFAKNVVNHPCFVSIKKPSYGERWATLPQANADGGINAKGKVFVVRKKSQILQLPFSPDLFHPQKQTANGNRFGNLL